jgi:hypothetical protein
MYLNDFIELYNPTSTAVNLTGWSVQYGSATGTTWTNKTNLSGTIPAYGYFLIQEASGGTNGIALPVTADQTGTINLSGTTGKVALVNNTTSLTGALPTGAQIIDFVGFGTANGYWGIAPAPAPSTITSIARKGAGWTYVPDNSTDFAAQTPAPQNNSTTTQPPAPASVTALGVIGSPTGDLALQWNAPAGYSEGVIVLVREAGAVVTAAPSLAYASVAGANANFSLAADAAAAGFGYAGDKLVYQGTGTSVTVTGLAPKATYYVSVLTGAGILWSAGVVISETALPVELVAFTASAKGKNVILAWSTATEMNNAGFAIEKKNAGGEWTKIAFVDGHGTTNVKQAYAYTDVCAAGTYSYRLKQIDRDGKYEYSSQVEAEIALTAAEYELGQNFPNPFNPATTIHFAVTSDQRAKLVVYNALGQEVATLFDGIARAQALQTVEFNASALASGTYFYMLQTADRREVKKMSLMK